MLVHGGLVESIAKLTGTIGVALAASPLPPKPCQLCLTQIFSWASSFSGLGILLMTLVKEKLHVIYSGDRISFLCVSFSSKQTFSSNLIWIV